MSSIRGKSMSDLSVWVQSYWFQLGSLLLQLGTLVTLVWFARRMLRIVLTSSEHAESLHPSSAPTMTVSAEAQPYSSGLRGLIPMDSDPSRPPAQAAYAGSGGNEIWHSIVKWMNTPMGNAPVAWRRWEIRRVHSV
jgi:hypothetical protein